MFTTNVVFQCSCLQVSVSFSELQPFTRSIIGSSPSSCSGVWDPWSVEYQSYTLAMLLKYCARDWLRSNICAVLRCRHHLDTEISVLHSFLYPKVPRVNVFRSFIHPNQIQRFHACILALFHWGSFAYTFRMYPINQSLHVWQPRQDLLASIHR